MCAWIIRPTAALIEAVSVPTIWMDHIAGLSAADGILTVYCSSVREGRPGYPSEEMLEAIVKLPTGRLPEIMMQGACAMQFLAQKDSAQGKPPNGFTPYLVR